jgi:hypothetical protein
LRWVNSHISSERLPELIVERLRGIRGQRASWIGHGDGVGNLKRVCAASRH